MPVGVDGLRIRVFRREGTLLTDRSAEAWPVQAPVPDEPCHSGGRYAGGLDARVGEVASVQVLNVVADLPKQSIRVFALPVPSDEPAHYFNGVGP